MIVRFGLTLSLFLTLGAVPAGAEAPVFKAYLEHPGVYALSYESFVEIGLSESAWPSARIGVRNLGQPVARWVDDGGDGVFGPGDRIEFVGDLLRGQSSNLDEYSRFNCYFVDFDDPEPLIGASRELPLESPATPDEAVVRLETREHHEQDLLMLRFPPKSGEAAEKWYWAKIAIGAKEPFRFVFTVDESIAEEEASVRFRLGLRGWSEPRVKLPEDLKGHRIEISLNGEPLDATEWNGQDPHVHEVEVPLAGLAPGENSLALSVPKRKLPDSDKWLIDVSMLNWIGATYPRASVVGHKQERFFLVDGVDDELLRLSWSIDGAVSVYTEAGDRLTGTVREGQVSSGRPQAVGDWLWAVPSGAFREPDELVLDRPSTLRSEDSRADYIMIAHHSLIAYIAPLVELHQRRGLEVMVVDVQDVFDEFNHGIVHPRAIRDLLSFAYHEWARPGPRFVLLVGDASWDYKNPLADDANYADWTYRPGETSRFGKNSSTPYAENAELNHRNLVPTWSYVTYQGHAASDNWFACVDGDDPVPDLALGRFPAASPEEAKAMVRKTVAFAEEPELGPWRRNLLFITNESVGFQRRSDDLAEDFLKRGYVPTKIYPKPSEPANEAHTQKIVDLFDQGLNVVHFLGHGGRYIWRTGPPDLKKNHDLFTLDHLDGLANTRRLPVVLSLTCYSAPFDHPTADSIGEKLLRMPDRGAIGVFAASWRNSPSVAVGRTLVEELSISGTTIGEAIMRAKAQTKNELLNHTYNLLGDPAVGSAAPMGRLALEIRSDSGQYTVRGTVEIEGFSGPGVVEIVGQDGETLSSAELEVREGRFSTTLGAGTASENVVRGARAYVWSDEAGRDAVGWAELASEELPAGASAEARAMRGTTDKPAPSGSKEVGRE